MDPFTVLTLAAVLASKTPQEATHATTRPKSTASTGDVKTSQRGRFYAQAKRPPGAKKAPTKSKRPSTTAPKSSRKRPSSSKKRPRTA